jgi:hypothetical protein
VTTETGVHRANDEEARRLIREQLRQTMLVEAGAGTGKTRALVDRFVALLLDGRRVEELAAVTFTEKAAAELRDRIRTELEWRSRRSDGDPHLLHRALGSLDRAQISTIHAFALNVLRPLAAESGIDPSFEVRDEVAGERRFQERWRSFLEDAGLESDTRDLVSRVLSLGLTTRDLENWRTSSGGMGRWRICCTRPRFEPHQFACPTSRPWRQSWMVWTAAASRTTTDCASALRSCSTRSVSSRQPTRPTARRCWRLWRRG